MKAITKSWNQKFCVVHSSLNAVHSVAA